MSTPPAYEQVIELLPAYVLGALEPDEMLTVEQYLDRSAALLERLRALEETAPLLALAAPDSPLSTAVKSTLIARARAESRAVLAAGVGEPAAPPRAHTMVAMFQRLTRGFGAARHRWSAAAALVSIVLLSAFAGVMQARVAQTSQRLLAAQNNLAQLQTGAAQQRRLLEFIAAADERTLLVSDAPTTRASFYRSATQGALLADGLPVLPDDHVYQLWLVGTQPVSVGLLPPPDDGRAALLMALPPATPFASVAVSVEPAGGSVLPRGPIILHGSIH